MRNRLEGHDAFTERISAPLRAPERADVTLADRVMKDVHGTGSPSWWRRPMTIRVTPLKALAIAAGIAAVMLTGARMLRSGDGVPTPTHDTAARVDTVHVVRFVLAAPTASRVALVGDFNRWDARMHQLEPAGTEGIWSISVALSPGQHEYAFVIDGTRWVADPAAALAVSDEFGGRSSVVAVGGVTPNPRSS